MGLHGTRDIELVTINRNMNVYRILVYSVQGVGDTKGGGYPRTSTPITVGY